MPLYSAAEMKLKCSERCPSCDAPCESEHSSTLLFPEGAPTHWHQVKKIERTSMRSYRAVLERHEDPLPSNVVLHTHNWETRR